MQRVTLCPILLLMGVSTDGDNAISRVSTPQDIVRAVCTCERERESQKGHVERVRACVIIYLSHSLSVHIGRFELPFNRPDDMTDFMRVLFLWALVTHPLTDPLFARGWDCISRDVTQSADQLLFSPPSPLTTQLFNAVCLFVFLFICLFVGLCVPSAQTKLSRLIKAILSVQLLTKRVNW